MRVVIPYYAAPDSMQDNMAHTLGEMGHEVRTLPAYSNRSVDSLWRRLLREVWLRTGNGARTPEEKWLLKVVREWKPDLILALTQQISDEVLAETRRLGVSARVAWWGDAPANLSKMELLSREWDLIFMKDPFAVDKMRRLGLEAHLLHEACNPAWHRPVAAQRNDEVVIAGSFYGYRNFLVERLIEAGVPLGLYGGRVPRWAPPSIRSRHRGRFIVRQEKSRIFGEGKACLNSSSMREGNSLNCRTFEIAGAGGFQIVEDRPVLSECFEPGRELVVFNSLEEILDVLRRIDREPEWADRIRAAGARRAHAEHTYQHRLCDIFSKL